MTDLPPPSLPPREPEAGRDGASRARLHWSRLLLVAGAGWLAWDTRVGVQSMESSAGGRLAELGAALSQSKASLAQAQASLKDAQARIAELEARVADTQEQRVALEEMYRELSRSADDRVLSEVEQMLVLASQQLQLAGNVRGALAALQAADQRLARAEKLAATPLRRAITAGHGPPEGGAAGGHGRHRGEARRPHRAEPSTLPLIIAETLPAARVASRARHADEPARSRAPRAISGKR